QDVAFREAPSSHNSGSPRLRTIIQVRTLTLPPSKKGANLSGDIYLRVELIARHRHGFAWLLPGLQLQQAARRHLSQERPVEFIHSHLEAVLCLGDRGPVTMPK